MTLAEAGKYIGTDAIEEYVKFATTANPYYLNVVTKAQKVGLS